LPHAAALPRHQFIAPLPTPDGERLENAVLGDALRQRLDIRRIESGAWLVGVGDDLAHIHLHNAVDGLFPGKR